MLLFSAVLFTGTFDIRAPVLKDHVVNRFRMEICSSEDEEALTAPAVFGVFEDETCVLPLKDADNNPVTVSADETGTIYAEDFSGCWLLQLEGPAGYYLDDTVYSADEVIHLKRIPIEPMFGMPEYDQAYHLTILDEDNQTAAEWISEEYSLASMNGDPIQFQPGGSYTLHCTDDLPWVHIEDQNFTVPMYEPEEEITISLEPIHYGSVVLDIRDDQNAVVQEGSFSVYTDQACRSAAFDIQNHKAELNISEDSGSLYLPEGTYYLKQTVSNPFVYTEKESIPVSVKNGEEISVTAVNPRVLIEIAMTAPDGTDVQGTMQLLSTQDNYVIEPEESHFLQVRKETLYHLQDMQLPCGYCHCQPVEFMLTDEQRDMPRYEIMTYPFTYPIYVKDAETDEDIDNCGMSLLNMAGEVITAFSSNDNISEYLKCGESYTVHADTMPEGYITPADIVFSVPDSDEEFSQPLFLYALPYVKVHFQPVRSLSYVLYQDEDCTLRAHDIYGREVTEDACLSSGTYYLKINQQDPWFYSADQPVRIVVDHAVEAEQTVLVKLPEILLEISAEDIHGRIPDNVNAVIYSAEGEVIKEIALHGKQIVNLSAENGLFRTGCSYKAGIVSADGLYTYDLTPITFFIPSNEPEEILSINFTLYPYYNIRIHRTNTDDSVFKTTYVLFTDQECTIPAYDIYSQVCQAEFARSGIFSFSVNRGTYYLRQVDADTSVYCSQQVQQINIDENVRTYDMYVSCRKVSLRIDSVNQKGSLLDDGCYELLDETGKVIEKWKEGSYLITDTIEAGSTYMIHEVSSPAGYIKQDIDIACTIPLEEPESDPAVRIVHEETVKNTVSNSSSDASVQDVSAAKKIYLLFPLILCGAIPVLKKFSKI